MTAGLLIWMLVREESSKWSMITGCLRTGCGVDIALTLLFLTPFHFLLFCFPAQSNDHTIAPSTCSEDISDFQIANMSNQSGEGGACYTLSCTTCVSLRQFGASLSRLTHKLY
ncbi:hypothetical protein K461DRAFT_182249 [Myriangium duriaei CBS 260.36]|uniref:Uncharacterized protein n=1 Tax=Myriangium duriaei CBS 260.36 TaxID=1168546 RepID=A0A9P4IZR2_9PEZI|nr:hypothetical protein K461DRAFT_182249 [Myriangium duriaei CBS 260.36]